MTGEVLHVGASSHRTAYELLPWLVNGTLVGDELVTVSAHVRGCARCRREVEFLHELHGACAKEERAPDPTRAFRRLSTCLDAPPLWSRLADVATYAVSSWVAAPHWVRWATAAQVLVLVAATVLIATISVDQPSLYHTLGSVTASRTGTATVVVKFRPDAADAAIQRAFTAAGARVVGGPTETRVYLLDVPSKSPDAALRALRADASVELAERLTAGPVP